MKRLGVLILIVSLMFTPISGLAWGVNGHQTIALIAQAQLTPQAQAIIDRLLAQEPGSSLMSISTWADENRDKATARWHYVNFPRGDCHYVPLRDCPDGQCVVAAIIAQNAILHSPAPDAEKLTALKFLVHLVGDIHQPLHAAYGDDRGGNTYSVQYQGEDSNLHLLWDIGMVEQFGRDSKSLARLISVQSVNQDLANSNDVTAWAESSCAIVARPDFYPDPHITEDYLNRFAPTVQEQLLLAGMRLAKLLNTLS
ncbi:hypothetical protein AAKU67_000632 [Oxalobacteraceae bacterium GrIS 2.11]